ncbi:MAG TPA: ABC transporter ATP-binding protein [Opitutaceae bacterium]|nr:ABC transporter ATP-binding protein [Opitutaceae bacterium]
MDSDSILQVTELKTHFFTDEGELPAVDGVTFSIPRGRTLALVGESGCGKTVTSYSILRLVQKPGRIVGGSIVLRPRRGEPLDVVRLEARDPRLFQLRGGIASMIFQEPVAALSPVHTIGAHLTEALQLHEPVPDTEARRRGVDMLRKVGISAPEKRFDQYPHELSGGMRQRVGIAIALICNPELLIADEPTTALDVTIQAQILHLIQSLQRELGCSVLLITHDLGVVAQVADEVAVMYLGRIVERGPVREVIKRPRHPYTQGLLRAIPSLNLGRRLESIPGPVPSLTAIPPGCPFHPRCPHAQAGRCDVGTPPPLRNLAPDHDAACVRAEEIAAEANRAATPHP